MIRCIVCLTLPVLCTVGRAAENASYELTFSTYVGGQRWEHARDICTDSDGNIFIVGGTASRDFPTTPGAYDCTFHEGGEQLGPAGPCDAFVMKFSPEGKLFWSTLLGGPNYDRAYAIEVDRKGDVYVAGRAGPGFPVSEGAFQTEYGGTRYNNFYGSQNGFVAKLAPDGDNLIWASYVAMLNEDGSDLVYGTYVGGRGQDWAVSTHTLALDTEGNAYVLVTTASPDFPVTPGAYSRQRAGPNDIAIVKLSPTGALLRSTLIGGSGQDGADGIYVDAAGNVCIVAQSRRTTH